jgi:hypothetical protein
VCVCVKVKDRNAELTTNQTATSHLIVSICSLQYLSVGILGEALSPSALF